MAIDFIGMGLHGGLIDDERGSRGVATRLVRPVPSAPEFRHLATTQGMSQMSPEGFRNWTGTRADTTPANPIFAHQGDAAGNHHFTITSPSPSPSSPSPSLSSPSPALNPSKRSCLPKNRKPGALQIRLLRMFLALLESCLFSFASRVTLFGVLHVNTYGL